MPFGLILAFFPGSKRAATTVLLVTSIGSGLKTFISYQEMSDFYPDLWTYLAYDHQFMQCLAIPLIAAYNGQRGGQGNSWEKNLFYIAYPLHLTLIIWLNLCYHSIFNNRKSFPKSGSFFLTKITLKEFTCSIFFWICKDIFWTSFFSDNAFIHENDSTGYVTGKLHFVCYHNHG